MQNRFKYYITLLLLSHLTVFLFGQSNNITNINFPSPEPGIMPEDMIYAGGKLFLYSGNGIGVYNSNGVRETTILLQEGGQPVGQAYIEMNHLIQTRTSYNTMVFDGQNKIYAVAPDYSVWSIDLSNNYYCTRVVLPPSMFAGRFFNGPIKLMYEPLSRWLFYAAQGPLDADADALPQFFGIYNTHTVPLYQTVYTLSETNKMPDIYDFLADFKIEENNGSGYVYMSRKRKIQIYQCSFNPINGNGSVALSRNDSTYTNKNGKLVMVQEPGPGGFKKIICLPMITRVDPDSFLYGIDALDPLNTDIQEISSADLQSRNWIDAVYESNRDQLLCAVKPNVISNQDFLVFDVSLNADNKLQLEFNSSQSLFTNNHYPTDTNNFPVNIFKPDQAGSTYYLSKKNEFGKISYNASSNPPYSWQCLDDQYNSFFERVVKNELSTLFIMKMKGGGYSSLPNMSSLMNIYTGQYLNRGFFYEQNNKVYIFNDDQLYPNKVFIMNPVDGSYSASQVEDIIIGDIIPNPFSDNEIIVSRYEDENGSIRVYDEELYSFDEYSTGANTKFCAGMFIDPEGFLYVLTGMKAGEPLRIKIFDARNGYTGPDPVYLSYSFPSSENPGYDVPAELTAKFVYNPVDRFVYIYITNNNVPKIHEEMLNRQTLILRVNKTGNFSIINSGYEFLTYDFVLTSENMLYLAMDNKLIQVNCSTGIATPYLENISIIDLEYDILTNQLFALERPGGDIQKLDVINLNDESITTKYLTEYQYVNSINFIEESRTIVAYAPIVENIDLPDDNVKILYIDVANDYMISEESLGLKALSRRDFFNKLNIDIIHDPIHKKLFIPNGFHSNVSMINDIPNEKLFLKNGWNWVSFPRLERQGDDPVPARPLMESIDPFPTYLQMINRPLQVSEPPTYAITYSNENWTGDLVNVQSTFGYKLETDNEDVSYLPMTGSVLDPETQITIYPGHENWVGYFLPETQHPFDAIPASVLQNLYFIKAQYWSCINTAFIAPPHKSTASSNTQWRCACNQLKMEMAYDDMVIMVLGTKDPQTFTWNRAGGGGNIIHKDAPEYFQFGEQADYEAIFIDLDSIDLPDEIGAFAGDSCIGATKVLPDDTAAMVCAYTQGFEGEEISFEMMYPTKATRPVIDDYLVFNKNSRIIEKGKITIGEKQPFYLVSFNKNKDNSDLITTSWIHCVPNPARDEATITYFVPAEARVQIILTNILGKEIMHWDQQRQTAGEYRFKVNTSSLPGGFYLVRAKAGNQSCAEKMLIVH